MFSDPEMLNLYIEMQKEIKPTLSIEVGAFDADYSKRMSNLGVECYAFEASPFVYSRFKNDMGDIKYINKAVSDQTGTIQFEMITEQDPRQIGHNSIKNRNAQTSYTYMDIEAVTLNSFFRDRRGARISLWIDCEGANREVLTGASGILPSVESILIETEDYPFWKDQWLHDDVVKYLSTYGFEIVHQKPALVHQRDVIFRRV